MRIGIGHPGHKDRVTGHVLGNYAKAEIDPLSDLLGAIAAEAPWLADGRRRALHERGGAAVAGLTHTSPARGGGTHVPGGAAT